MTLDEAIRHAEEVADTCEYEAGKYDVCDSYEKGVAYQEGKCAEEHRQLAEWLKELKELRKQKRPHGDWEYLKELITDVRDADGRANQKETCQFILNLMRVIERGR